MNQAASVSGQTMTHMHTLILQWSIGSIWGPQMSQVYKLLCLIRLITFVQLGKKCADVTLKVELQLHTVLYPYLEC